MSILETINKINKDRLPKHIAIIMDGNGRWARKRFMPRTAGHRAGMGSLRRIVETCVELKLPILTVYAFSTENWKRPQDEVNYLMNLLVEFLHKEINDLHENNVKVKVLGDYTELNDLCKKEVDYAINKTKDNTGLIFNIALNYGSRREILLAIKKIVGKVKEDNLQIEEIDEEVFSRYLYTSNMPDPDLLIRTAGEMRISNFLLWQIAYTEIWITNKLWPDFNSKDLVEAILDYQNRDRRFGGIK